MDALCDQCRSERPPHVVQSQRRKAKGDTTDRGYGARHRALRAEWAPRVQAGTVLCARGADCKRAHLPGGRLLIPGEPWDLGHDDNDRTRYAGPEHPECNRATAGRRKERQGRKSRDW